MAKYINPFTDAVFQKLESIADVGNMTRAERLQYDESLKKSPIKCIIFHVYLQIPKINRIFAAELH